MAESLFSIFPDSNASRLNAAEIGFLGGKSFQSQPLGPLKATRKRALVDVGNTFQAKTPVCQQAGKSCIDISQTCKPISKISPSSFKISRDVDEVSCKPVLKQSPSTFQISVDPEDENHPWDRDTCSACSLKIEDDYTDIRPMSDRLKEADLQRVINTMLMIDELPAPDSPTFEREYILREEYDVALPDFKLEPPEWEEDEGN